MNNLVALQLQNLRYHSRMQLQLVRDCVLNLVECRTGTKSTGTAVWLCSQYRTKFSKLRDPSFLPGRAAHVDQRVRYEHDLIAQRAGPDPVESE